MHKVLTSFAKTLVSRLIVILTSPWESWVYCSTFGHNDERF